MKDAGADVQVRQGDVSDAAVVAAIIDSIPAGAPLRGVVHCAGQTKDAAVSRQSWETFQEVLTQVGAERAGQAPVG